MAKVSNMNCRALVDKLEPFKANHIFAEYTNRAYVVYSFGRHFPMYVNRSGCWYENTDRYSVSTSRHQSQSRPSRRCVPLDTQQLREIINADGAA